MTADVFSINASGLDLAHDTNIKRRLVAFLAVFALAFGGMVATAPTASAHGCSHSSHWSYHNGHYDYWHYHLHYTEHGIHWHNWHNHTHGTYTDSQC